MKSLVKHGLYACLMALLLTLMAPAIAQDSFNIAPGFTKLSAGAKVIVVPVDMELFSISAGGVPEPRADWTAQATGHFNAALDRRSRGFGLQLIHMTPEQLDAHAELSHLHAVVAQSILAHYLSQASLPTKEGKLNWTLGQATADLQEQTKADYVLFTYVRDSYASGERVATMILAAAVGVSLGGGAQYGYGSLVDLRDGRIVWFNRLFRGFGDLRAADKAVETVDILLGRFPAPLQAAVPETSK